MRKFKDKYHKQEYMKWLSHHIKKAQKTHELDYVCSLDYLISDGAYDACIKCPYLALDTQMCLHRIHFGAIS